MAFEWLDFDFTTLDGRLSHQIPVPPPSDAPLQCAMCAAEARAASHTKEYYGKGKGEEYSRAKPVAENEGRSSSLCSACLRPSSSVLIAAQQGFPRMFLVIREKEDRAKVRKMRRRLMRVISWCESRNLGRHPRWKGSDTRFAVRETVGVGLGLMCQAEGKEIPAHVAIYAADGYSFDLANGSDFSTK